MASPIYLEVVQAQEAVAAASENYIESLVLVQRGDDLFGARHGRRGNKAPGTLRRQVNMARTVETEVLTWMTSAVARSQRADAMRKPESRKVSSRKLSRWILAVRCSCSPLARRVAVVVALAKLRIHRRRADRRAPGFGQHAHQRNRDLYQSASREQPVRRGGNPAAGTRSARLRRRAGTRESQS